MNLLICNYSFNDTIFVIDNQSNTFTRNTSVNYMFSKIKIFNSTASVIDETFIKVIFWDLDGSIIK